MLTNCPYDILYIIITYLDITSTVMVHYTSKGLQDIVKIYYQKISYKIDIRDVIIVASENGYLPLLQWLELYVGKIVKKDDCCIVAALFGHFELLKWVYNCAKKNIPEQSWGDKLWGWVDIIGQPIRTLKLSYNKPNNGPFSNAVTNMICESASQGGHLDILKWAKENNFEITYNCIRNAAQGGHMETLQWLRCEDVWKNNLNIWRNNASQSAASGGHLHVLRWLVDYGENLNSGTYIGAAKNGNLHILKWLCDRFMVDYSGASALAAQSGHLNIIKWAIECGVKEECEIKSNIWTNVAAYYGHLHILVWATEHNYELSEHCLNSSISEGHLHVLKWLLDLGFKITEHSFYFEVCEKKKIFYNGSVLHIRNGHQSVMTKLIIILIMKIDMLNPKLMFYNGSVIHIRNGHQFVMTKLIIILIMKVDMLNPKLMLLRYGLVNK